MCVNMSVHLRACVRMHVHVCVGVCVHPYTRVRWEQGKHKRWVWDRLHLAPMALSGIHFRAGPQQD